MPGLEGDGGDALVEVASAEYSVLHQRVDLDIDFATRSLKGSTEVTVQPHVKNLRGIRLHCRQCKPTAIQAGGITAKYEYDDPYRKLRMQGDSNVHQHEMLKTKIAHSLQPAPLPELLIFLPARLKIQELHVDPTSQLPEYNGIPSLQQQESDAIAMTDTPRLAATISQQGPQFAPIKLFIEFEVDTFRDGLHWIGCDPDDKRYPYVYTKAEPLAGNTSCIFPSLDDANSRCSWEISIRCPRTLGDAFRVEKTLQTHSEPSEEAQIEGEDMDDVEMVNGAARSAKMANQISSSISEYLIELSDDDAALDLAVICVGEQTDDVVDSEDETRHTVTFVLNEPCMARHIGFAIGPFERINLSSSRDAEEEERLGQSAVKVEGFCLPDRGAEVRNTCFPLTRAVDHFGVAYGSFPFATYQLLFVDDLIYDTVPTAGLTFCSSRLLFPDDVIEFLESYTRILIRAVADQWAGVSIVAKEPSDAWVVAGIAGYMADLYGKLLFGNNAYRWQQKLASEKVYDLDVDRPSIHQHGSLLHLDPSLKEFLDLKSALVLFILDRRLMKASGTSGCQRIINRIFLQAKTGALENGEVSTAEFQRVSERYAHVKLDYFFKQWVFGAGCPIFYVTQKFNKKKLVVEMTIQQRQLERKTKPPFAPNNFMREIKEHVQEVWAPEPQPVFTGPMTIRIHEADGTPYEHIVEIKEPTTKLEIPYNTKYKRLKRSRRQKERAMAEGTTGEGGEDALLYCLGDILDSPEEMMDWNLQDWSTEDEEKMRQESYEWIRMDADFEWIGRMHLVMPLYMYISQLQQDRDLVAQYESMKWLMGTNPHHVSLSILVRTLMDRRYFHGIRSMAAEGLAVLASRSLEPPHKEIFDIGLFHLQKSFDEMFCFSGEIMPRPNEWTDRTNYIIQCAIPRAMAQLRDKDRKVPMSIRKFFVDKLKFNDNSDNPFSDCHYVATLMTCLTDSLVVSHREITPQYDFRFGGGDDEPEEPENPDEPFEREAINEIERYRRIDEWITTYHNTYSITALDCLQKLIKGGLVKDKNKDVLQYTRPANGDLVRLGAFACLTRIGLTRRMPMMKYLLNSIVNATSPYFRNRLIAIFGEALGHIALGDEPEKLVQQASQAPEPDGLVLEQEASSEVRHIEATRKTTPEGAIAALKVVLGNSEVFKKALWHASTSPGNTLEEVAAFCDVAALLYQPIASCRVTLKLPPMWTCKNLGKGKVSFTPRLPYRTKPRSPLSRDDWQDMLRLGLRYTGPKPEEAHIEQQRRKSSLEDEKSLKERRAEFLAQGQLGSQMLPPNMPPLPSTETMAIKLKIGAKRKSSVDLSSQRAGSPKTQKLSRQQTPNGFAQSPSARRSPSVATQRRGSTPGTKSSLGKRGSHREPVKLRFSQVGFAKVQDIITKLARPHIGMPMLATAQPEQTQALPSTLLPQQPPPTLFASTMLQSPTGSGNNYFSASTLGSSPLNLGAFRSYGPTTDTNVSAAPEVDRESKEADGILANIGVPSNTTLLQEATESGSMPPPPRPKLTLKLGRKPSASSVGRWGSP